MLTIRLQRVGRRHDPAHRVVVQESSQSPKSGRFVENLGAYNPRKEGHSIDADRASYWVAQGAQVSPTVHNLFVDLGVVSTSKMNPLPRKSPIQPEASDNEEASAPAAGVAPSDEGAAASESTADSQDGEESQESSTDEAAQESSEETAADSTESEETTS